MASYTRFYSLYTTPAGSDITSRTIYVGDATDLTLSLTTVNTNSGYTVQVNNGEGFRTPLNANAWSTVTVLGAQGEFDIEPGSRWMRFLRPSTSSATVAVHAQNFT